MVLTSLRSWRSNWPRPFAGTNSTVKAFRPPTTACVPSGSCWLEAYHLDSCNAVVVSTQSHCPSSPQGQNVLICCIAKPPLVQRSVELSQILLESSMPWNEVLPFAHLRHRHPFALIFPSRRIAPTSTRCRSTRTMAGFCWSRESTQPSAPCSHACSPAIHLTL